MNDLHISSNAITTIQFPFTIMIDIASQEDQAIVFKLMSDCGLGGNRQEKIRLDYRVEATIDIIGLSIQIPYSDTVDFDCPMNVSCYSHTYFLHYFNLQHNRKHLTH